MAEGDQVLQVSELLSSCTPGENTRDVSRGLKFPRRSASLFSVRRARLRGAASFTRGAGEVTTPSRGGGGGGGGGEHRFGSHRAMTHPHSHHWSNVFSRPCQGWGHNHGQKGRNFFNGVFIGSCGWFVFGLALTTYEDDFYTQHFTTPVLF